MKKAQLTMFIILGIVIISIFGFVFFATGQVRNIQSSAQTQKIVSDILQSTPLKFYVGRCADLALESGIDLLSKQGGKIFPGQPGNLLKNPEKAYVYREDSKNKTYDVAYAVLKDNTPLPQYPCKIGFDNYDKPEAYCEYRSTIEIQPGIFVNNSKFSNLDFGIVNLPRLCKNSFSGCTFREGWDTRFSVQSQLESYVADYIKKCVDFESIVSVAQSYNVTEGDPSANITFSDTEISATINFPIIISPIGSQPIINLFNFQSTVPTRFKLIYGLAREAVVKDVSSPTAPTYNLFEGLKQAIINRFKGSDSGLLVEKNENITSYDNIIKIIDTTEKDRNSVFQFLEENRPPVLEYVNPRGKISTKCGEYDLILLQGQNFDFKPEAFDTEENNIQFNYSGWLADYNETISPPYTYDEKGCVINYVSNKHNFLNSQDKRVKPNGLISTPIEKSDTGPHTLTVYACDSQYCDSENVRVLVDDLLEVNVNGSNRFGTQTFSIEDPYSFSADIKDIWNPGNYLFSWIIKDRTTNNVIYQNDSGGQTISLPLENYDIFNIKQKYMSYNGQPFILTSGKYTAIGSVSQGLNQPIQSNFDFDVKNCLPTPGNTNPPFPYYDGDPFDGNHACCESTGDLSSTTKQCYTPTPTYGSFMSFNTDKYKTQYDAGQTVAKSGVDLDQIKTSFATGQVTSTTNDIFKRVFTRNCDRKRGNMCNGTMTETYVDISVPDKQSGESATCFGPPRKYLKANTITEEALSSTPSYEKYGENPTTANPITTFEKEVGITNSSSCNDNKKCVSDNNAAYGYTLIGQNPHYVCSAACSVDGCTRTVPDPSICINCYDQQACTLSDGTPAPTIPTPGSRNSFSIKQFNTCVQTNSCQYTTSTTADSCNGDFLTDYYCKQDLSQTGTVLNQQQINCTDYNRQSALDDGDTPLSAGTCTYYDKSLCSNGQCQPQTTPINKQEGRQTNSTTSEYYYQEYIIVNNQCKEKDYNYDTNPTLCTSTVFDCASGPKQGTYDGSKLNVQDRCIGDDLSERQTC